ncbi:MAG: hypothetical protein MSC30_16420 [Gaiellaceae bacterium MAG52_C11]|nr:hypothetical protein [Candidatus Gaiellasilicea maunaloa]
MPFALLAVVVAAVIWQAPQSFVDAAREIASRRDLTDAQRTLAPVRSNDLPIEAFTGAADAIPADATYHVVVGENIPLRGNQEIALTPLYQYWLFPRRSTRRLADAEWVIAYGASTETLGIRLRERQVEVSPGVVVAEVER